MSERDFDYSSANLNEFLQPHLQIYYEGKPYKKLDGFL